MNIQVNLNQKYMYTSNTIRPKTVAELFPVDFGVDFDLESNGVDLSNKDSVNEHYESAAEKMTDSISGYGFDDEYAQVFHLTELVHFSKAHPPKPEDAVSDDQIKTIDDYLEIPYAHCGNKSLALSMLFNEFDIEHSVISYSDINGWAHGFTEVTLQGRKEIFCPTFNMWMSTNTDQLMANPFTPRRYMCMYSPAYYSASKDEDFYDEHIGDYVDQRGHTTKKYNIEWFSMIGMYPLVPPIYTLTRDGEQIYDIRKDNRFSFVKTQ